MGGGTTTESKAPARGEQSLRGEGRVPYRVRPLRHRTPPVLRRFARVLEHLVVAIESTDVDAVREAQITEALTYARPLLRAYRAGAFREDTLSTDVVGAESVVGSPPS